LSIKRVILTLGASALSCAMIGAILFLVAGRYDLPWFWAYVGVFGLFSSVGWLLLDPDLIRERLRPGKGSRDAGTVQLGKLFSMAHFVIASLDVGRFHWSDNVPAWLQGTALTLFAASGVAALWTMIINPFFASVIRIQTERGHRLITDGPYRIVRHPGYTLITVMMFTSGIALGSWFSALPIWMLWLLLIRRTVLEDRFLHDHLDGYPQYAQRVRYRLVPGIW
jgi:protein-S-isoprenylcysteine O-methyltransferase Ste14